MLTRRFARVTWTALAGYALLVVLAFAVSAEAALRRSLEHSADLTEALLEAYPDTGTAPGGAMPAALADQLVGMGGRELIIRTVRGRGGAAKAYFLSPGMPAKRLEGLPAGATPDEVRAALLAAIARRARWRYRVLHRRADPYDLYVVASRESYLFALAALMAAAALLLPLAGLAARRGVRRAVAAALRPLERIGAETRAIGPAELGKRITSPTGQAEVTDLAESINRMLERVDRAHRALQSFTADASHELRTPLAHLRGQVQWASAEGRSPADVRDALGDMERELDRTATLVEELLLIARGENRQLALAHAPFDLGAVAEEVCEITAAMAEGKTLAVRLEAGSRPGQAVGDAGRTRHILLNLAANAVRYTPAGSVTIALRGENGRVGVSVRDTGPGIPAEYRERIFDRFFRIDRSRSRAGGGVGLGLAIARLLAELQDGTVTVESAPGAGSTFTLWLPAAEATPEPEA